MAQTTDNTVNAAERTFRVVRWLQELDGAGVTELSSHLGLPKSTVHNYLSTLDSIDCIVCRLGHISPIPPDSNNRSHAETGVTP